MMLIVPILKDSTFLILMYIVQMILIEFGDDAEATVIWAGTHKEYEDTFKNNKKTIATWLRNREHIK
jgi:hypothetical protein